MVNSFSAGKGQLVEPPYGSYVDEWQKPVNSNFGLTDALISGTTTINTNTILPSVPYVTLVFNNFDTTSTPWLNPLAGQNIRIVITGSLSFNITIYIPQNYPGLWIIDNQTTGNFTISVLTTAAGSIGITAPINGMGIIFCDGTNIRYADAGGAAYNGVPAGTIISFGGSATPYGYLTCDGTAVSRTTYASLFGAIGITWGAGNGSTTFNVPDLRGMIVRGTGTNGTQSGATGPAVGAYQSDGVGPLGISDPGHRHVVQFDITQGPAANVSFAYNGVSNYAPRVTETSTTGISVSGTISETRPKNMGVSYIIKI